MTRDQFGVLGHGLLIFAATCGLALAGAVALPKGGYPISETVSASIIIMLVLLGTALIVVALRFTRSGKLFGALFALALLSGSCYLFNLFLPTTVALVAGSAAVIAHARWKKVGVFNLTMAIGIAGMAVSVVSSLSVNAILIIFSSLAFYDIVAVYGTGHMVRMFRDLVSRGVIFAFILPPLSPRNLAETLTAKTGTVTSFYLGTGDVALPAMLAAAAVRSSLAHGIAAALGAMAGHALMFILFTNQDHRRPMPALPPIAFGAISFYLASLILLP